MSKFISIKELYDCFVESEYNITTDTRKLPKGALFVALKGDKFNANEFAQLAIEKGCCYAIVDEEKYITHPNIKLVADSLEALQQLANYHRHQFQIPFLAITGSNGKTTNKELIHAILSKKYNCLATHGNLNNHIGVPLTILRLRKEHEFAIIEMGANHQGEIAALCKIAEPDYGLITNIGKAHLEGFGGIEGVKKGKGELYSFIKNKNGQIFINADDQVLFELALNINRIKYGINNDADVIGKDFTESETVSFKFSTPNSLKSWDKLPLIKSQLIGGYNFINCLAAACIGHYFKVDDASIKNAIEEYCPTMNRSQLLVTNKNKIILDAYNANPNSMKLAIENFAKLPDENKLLLLGDMFELGVYSQEEHLKIIELLQSFHLSNAILVGEEFCKLKPSAFKTFKTTPDCLKHLKQSSITNTTILIKGSRGMKMEVLQEAL